MVNTYLRIRDIPQNCSNVAQCAVEVTWRRPSMSERDGHTMAIKLAIDAIKRRSAWGLCP